MSFCQFLKAVYLAQRHVDKLSVWASAFGGKVFGGGFKAHICLAKRGLNESIIGGARRQMSLLPPQTE
jgi:hypothetical protein